LTQVTLHATKCYTLVMELANPGNQMTSHRYMSCNRRNQKPSPSLLLSICFFL